jgi:hypothetical protein
MALTELESKKREKKLLMMIMIITIKNITNLNIKKFLTGTFNTI